MTTVSKFVDFVRNTKSCCAPFCFRPIHTYVDTDNKIMKVYRFNYKRNLFQLYRYKDSSHNALQIIYLLLAFCLSIIIAQHITDYTWFYDETVNGSDGPKTLWILKAPDFVAVCSLIFLCSYILASDLNANERMCRLISDNNYKEVLPISWSALFFHLFYLAIMPLPSVSWYFFVRTINSHAHYHVRDQTLVLGTWIIMLIAFLCGNNYTEFSLFIYPLSLTNFYFLLTFIGSAKDVYPAIPWHTDFSSALVHVLLVNIVVFFAHMIFAFASLVKLKLVDATWYIEEPSIPLEHKKPEKGTAEEQTPLKPIPEDTPPGTLI